MEFDVSFHELGRTLNISILLFQDIIGKNFHSIRLKPDQFSSYLTTEVGFTSFEYLGAPKCSIKGNLINGANIWNECCSSL